MHCKSTLFEWGMKSIYGSFKIILKMTADRDRVIQNLDIYGTNLDAVFSPQTEMPLSRVIT
jgi:hypothetical protein